MHVSCHGDRCGCCRYRWVYFVIAAIVLTVWVYSIVKRRCLAPKIDAPADITADTPRSTPRRSPAAGQLAFGT